MKQFKQMMACALALCLLTAAVPAFAAETTTPEKTIRIVQTTDLQDGYTSFSRYTGGVTVTVKTIASSQITRVYHDVTIYKNGVWQLSETYAAWGTDSLTTKINVSASSGDRIEVYVDHRTNNNGYEEVVHKESIYKA